MGQRGPAPTPTAQLALRGSWRAKLNRREPCPEPGSPACPRRLGTDEKKVWRSLCRILADMGLAAKSDGSMLERYCRFFVRWRACEDFIAKNGISYPLKADGEKPPRTGYVGKLTTGEYVVSWVEFPQVRESHRLHKSLKDIEDRFGLSPSARTRIQTLSESGPKPYEGAAVYSRPRTSLDLQGAPTG